MGLFFRTSEELSRESANQMKLIARAIDDAIKPFIFGEVLLYLKDENFRTGAMEVVFVAQNFPHDELRIPIDRRYMLGHPEGVYKIIAEAAARYFGWELRIEPEAHHILGEN